MKIALWRTGGLTSLSDLIPNPNDAPIIIDLQIRLKPVLLAFR